MRDIKRLQLRKIEIFPIQKSQVASLTSNYNDKEIDKNNQMSKLDSLKKGSASTTATDLSCKVGVG